MKEQTSQPITYGTGRMELWISRVLLYGVLLAGLITMIGLIVFVVRGGIGGESLSDLVDQQKHAASFGSILHGVAKLNGKSIIQLGLFVLILTPISRVAMSLFFFVRERDRVYVAITGIVLCILLGGLIGSALTS
jgi:uncharacterized membrane protein